MTVPAFGGSQSVKMAFQGEGTKLLGARPNAFPTNRVGGTASVENVPAPAAPSKGAKVSGPFGTEGAEEAGHLGKAPDGHDIWMPAATRAKLEEAQIIVSGGRGLGGPQDFKLSKTWPTALGASLGASRAAVDAGWIPYAASGGPDRQDGQANGLHRLRHLRRRATQSWHGHVRPDYRHQQG